MQDSVLCKPTQATAPMAGWVVRLIEPSDWKFDVTALRLRRLGAKVVTRDAASTTHIVTMGTPPDPGGPRGGLMTDKEFRQYVCAVSYSANRGKPVTLMGLEALNRTLSDMTALAEAQQAHSRAAIFDVLAPGAGLSGAFVGF